MPAGSLRDQFVENIVVKWDTFAGAYAFDVLSEIAIRDLPLRGQLERKT